MPVKELRRRIDAPLAIGAIFPMRLAALQIRREFSYAKYVISDPGVDSACGRPSAHRRIGVRRRQARVAQLPAAAHDRARVGGLFAPTRPPRFRTWMPATRIASATPRFMLVETGQPPRKSFGRIRHRRASIVLGGPGETSDTRWNRFCFHEVKRSSCAHDSTLARPVHL
ncbi:hypothetical protein LGM71_23260 [Burkholderia sp. AU33545]|uniref:hypothetical protein n=1 Tax=Burkholderia sp. AU33545 TaxID=2879631 RepID=UPI001CF34E34|nr:hypothetical protein [Burkholderia sp. AU33545]MCA8203973.1 hypothetical protein [Burkholderia sp. AU33545]